MVNLTKPMHPMPDIMDREWPERTPPLPKHLPPCWNRLWSEAWSLHPRSCRLPVGLFDMVWESVGAGYLAIAFGHWDIVHSVLDLLVGDPIFAARQVDLVIKTMRDSDGRLPGIVYEKTDERAVRRMTPIYDYSPPPLWPAAAVEVFSRTRNRDCLEHWYRAAVKGVGWWERNRRLDDGLFWFADCVGNSYWESGYDLCPRWDGLEGNQKPFACVDLCGQMGLYYESLALMADELGESAEAENWRTRSSELAEMVRTTLWHEGDGMFYDRDIDAGRWIRIKTVASFWPMVAGQASSRQVDRLVAHLTDPREFFTPIPVPSVALNEPAFSLDCWRGPTWLSQTYWIVRGLRRCEHHEPANKIITRALDGVAEIFDRHGTIFEFWHPHRGPVDELKRKGKTAGPCRDYIGHNPIHALALCLGEEG